MRKNIFSITQVNSYIKSMIEEDVVLSEIYIKGEISNFKLHSSGHMYFTLKDQGGSIHCVMFKSNAQMLDFMPVNGQSVVAFGRIGVYEKTGQYQLYALSVEESGKGALYEKFEKLKTALYNEGLFREEYKKKLPESPACISIITSPTGAAVRDIIKVSKKRNPYIKLVVIPCLVQGEEAPASIAEAIRQANSYNKSDLIILGRGGGSMEDLWAFNEAVVARAIFDSKIPVISAVGHETDVTIADFVADIRAATPSAAVEIAVSDYRNQIHRLSYLYAKMERSINYKLAFCKNSLKNISGRPVMKRPLDKVFQSQIYLENINKDISRNIAVKINEHKNKLSLAFSSLNAASPLHIMSKGYSAVFGEEKLIRGIDKLNVADKVKIKFIKGSAEALITEISEDDGIG